MKLARFSLDVVLFYVAFAWPWVTLAYLYIHFAHPELVYLTKRLDQWQSHANPRLWT